MSLFQQQHPMLEQLRRWADCGALRDLDLALASFIHQELPDTPASVLLAAALVSTHNGQGHVCLNLRQALQQPDSLLSAATTIDGEQAMSAQAELASQLSGLSLSQWLEALGASPAVHNQLHGQADKHGDTPLVLAGSPQQPLLYLRRY